MGYDAWLDRPYEGRAFWEAKCERAEEEIRAMPLSQIIDMIGEEKSRETLLDAHIEDLVDARASDDGQHHDEE